MSLTFGGGASKVQYLQKWSLGHLSENLPAALCPLSALGQLLSKPCLLTCV